MIRIRHYFDYKSPYAYLAQDASLALVDEFGVEVELIRYTPDIPSYLGSAEVTPSGEIVKSERNDHQWRRVRYSYMDCRREANARGIVLRGPRKIFDSSLAHIAFLYAQRSGNALAFHNLVFLEFWRRELDIEDIGAISGALNRAAIDGDGFAAYSATEGRQQLLALQREAEDEFGVFGVPSYVIDGELFWGTERLGRVRERLAKRV